MNKNYLQNKIELFDKILPCQEQKRFNIKMKRNGQKRLAGTWQAFGLETRRKRRQIINDDISLTFYLYFFLHPDHDNALNKMPLPVLNFRKHYSVSVENIYKTFCVMQGLWLLRRV